jgi:hypothetical protein
MVRIMAFLSVALLPQTDAQNTFAHDSAVWGTKKIAAASGSGEPKKSLPQGLFAIRRRLC